MECMRSQAQNQPGFPKTERINVLLICGIPVCPSTPVRELLINISCLTGKYIPILKELKIVLYIYYQTLREEFKNKIENFLGETTEEELKTYKWH